MSQLTSHILDTSLGIPAREVSVTLFALHDKEWKQIAAGLTNNDGRITNLLDDASLLPHGLYKLHFNTKEYFERNFTASFFPFVEIAFYINSHEHYHVPLLLSPFGYSTYRGS
ncbi:hydroxyisourate hydrolase [Chitinophaga sancti]|uniref:hydroxyisourate hydrolase n=1 Tax=Chitinophaga sancti TaxID=1004 RepID=UPI002A76223F|nr:hydroxyisourate hydrolase [Chitinophaga sancti]WPQ62602.1 hydroxyisourate hydrolase [Chitinophaga sancti]